MNKFATAIPQRSPLRLRCHLIIGEDRAHIGDGVLKNGGGCEFVKVLATKRELKRTEYRVGVGSHNAFK